jgi:hypothetical protein
MTNFERIKAMSVDELAEFLEDFLESDVCIMHNTFTLCHECKYSSLCDLSRGEAKKWLNEEECK